MGMKVFNSVSELLYTLGLPAPLHPLIAVTNYADITTDVSELSKGLVLNMYKISFKFNFKGQLKYGQQYYDFNEGGLSFSAPMQVISATAEEADYSGLTLLVHPDFLRMYPLAKTIRDYGFFDYSVHEALYLSEQEKTVITGIFESIMRELQSSIDKFSQDIIISQLEQLLNYSNRFYNRQFITRKVAHNDLLSKLDELISKELLPVEEIARRLGVSQRYLSDMLRSLIGLNTQQYLHNKMTEKAKELLSATSLTISEIAYELGFEYPQSFNKFFKKQTAQSPLDFRNSFN
jgi:AraC family transcriptional regulator, transcriptional activator of pobA